MAGPPVRPPLIPPDLLFLNNFSVAVSVAPSDRLLDTEMLDSYSPSKSAISPRTPDGSVLSPSFSAQAPPIVASAQGVLVSDLFPPVNLDKYKTSSHLGESSSSSGALKSLRSTPHPDQTGVEFSWAAHFKSSGKYPKADVPVTVSAEGHPWVKIPNAVFERGARLHSDYIVGIFYGNAPSYEKIWGVLNYLWGKDQRVTIHNLTKNAFLFHIPSASLRRRILQHELWRVGDSPFYVTEWKSSFSLDPPSLQRAPIWASIHKIPFDLLTDEGLSFISKPLGVIVDAKPFSTISSVEIKVIVNLSTPLPSTVELEREDGRIDLLQVTYPWLPPLCPLCSKIGHKATLCPNAPPPQSKKEDFVKPKKPVRKYQEKQNAESAAKAVAATLPSQVQNPTESGLEMETPLPFCPVSRPVLAKPQDNSVVTTATIALESAPRETIPTATGSHTGHITTKDVSSLGDPLPTPTSAEANAGPSSSEANTEGRLFLLPKHMSSGKMRAGKEAREQLEIAANPFDLLKKDPENIDPDHSEAEMALTIHQASTLEHSSTPPSSSSFKQQKKKKRKVRENSLSPAGDSFFWNVRGINDTSKHRPLATWLRNKQATFGALLETHVRESNKDQILSSVGPEWSVLSNYQHSETGRIWIIYKQPTIIQHLFSDHQSITCDVKLEDDLPFQGPRFTWSNNRPSNPIGRKLDRCLVNGSWTLSFPSSHCSFLAPEFSDHCPCHIKLTTDSPTFGSRPFKFFNLLTSHPAFLYSIKSAWDDLGESAKSLKELCYKIKGLKRPLKALFRENFSDIEKRECEAHQHTLSRIHHRFALSPTALPVCYLGLPLCSKKLSVKDYDPLITQIRRKVGSWVHKRLSLAGRLRLISSIVYGIVGFWTKAFILPKKMIAKINSMAGSFLWHGKAEVQTGAKVSWPAVCFPMQEGGLGLRSLTSWNETCALKLIWMLFFRGGSIWVAWMRTKYLSKFCFWALKEDTPAVSWMFRKLLKLCHKAISFIQIQIGNGDDTFFWWDPWTPFGSLIHFLGPMGPATMGIPLFSLVRDCIQNGNWNLRAASLPLLATPPCGLCKKETNAIRSKNPTVSWYSLVWHKVAIPKHAAATWLFMLNRNPTFDRMVAWVLDVETICLLCGSSSESQNHLFFDCPFSNRVWSALLLKLDILNAPTSWAQIISWLPAALPQRDAQLGLLLLWQASIYELWKERNRRLHQGLTLPHYKIFKKIVYLMRNKTMALKNVCSKHSEALTLLWS
ncbi:unnamed protein product, partial [Thlaspi arvense]